MSRNYTQEETQEIVDTYLLNPTLEMVTELSVKYRKTRKSIIAKLSKEGVYKRKVYTSKCGTLPITKLEILAKIEDALGRKFNQLDKAPKQTLVDLEKSVTQLQNDFDYLLGEYEKQSTTLRVMGEMGRF